MLYCSHFRLEYSGRRSRTKVSIFSLRLVRFFVILWRPTFQCLLENRVIDMEEPPGQAGSGPPMLEPIRRKRHSKSNVSRVREKAVERNGTAILLGVLLADLMTSSSAIANPSQLNRSEPIDRLLTIRNAYLQQISSGSLGGREAVSVSSPMLVAQPWNKAWRNA